MVTIIDLYGRISRLIIFHSCGEHNRFIFKIWWHFLIFDKIMWLIREFLFFTPYKLNTSVARHLESAATGSYSPLPPEVKHKRHISLWLQLYLGRKGLKRAVFAGDHYWLWVLTVQNSVLDLDLLYDRMCESSWVCK